MAHETAKAKMLAGKAELKAKNYDEAVDLLAGALEIMCVEEKILAAHVR